MCACVARHQAAVGLPCSTCGACAASQPERKLRRLPRLLLLVIDHRRPSLGEACSTGSGLPRAMRFPPNGLNLSCLLEADASDRIDDNAAVYDCAGVIEQHRQHSGHCTAIVQLAAQETETDPRGQPLAVPRTASWLACDDTHLRLVESLPQSLPWSSRSASLLFFRRRDVPKAAI